MDAETARILGLSLALGGLFYLWKSFDYGFRTQNRFYEYVINPLERRRTDRSNYDLTIPNMTVDEIAYNAFLDDMFIDVTTRVGYQAALELDGAYRIRGEYTRYDPSLV